MYSVFQVIVAMKTGAFDKLIVSVGFMWLMWIITIPFHVKRSCTKI